MIARTPSFDTDAAMVLWWLTDIRSSITQAALQLPPDEADDYVETRLTELSEATGQGRAVRQFWKSCERLVRIGVEADLDQARQAITLPGVLQ